MRAKPKADPDFRQRLLDYIAAMVSETMPKKVIDECIRILDRYRIFQPFIDPNDPDIEEIMKHDVNDIVRSSNMHSRSTHRRVSTIGPNYSILRGQIKRRTMGSIHNSWSIIAPVFCGNPVNVERELSCCVLKGILEL